MNNYCYYCKNILNNKKTIFFCNDHVFCSFDCRDYYIISNINNIDDNNPLFFEFLNYIYTNLYKGLQKIFKDRAGLLHGSLDKIDKDKILNKFLNKKF